MKLIKYEKLESLSLLHQLPLFDAGENQLQHDVVCQQDVGRVLANPLASLFVFLAGIAVITNQGLVFAKPTFEELVEFFLLAVGQSIHRVDDDGLYAPPSPTLQNVIDDRNDIGEALSGSGSRGQHV